MISAESELFTGFTASVCKIHSLLNLTTIFINKVTFFGQDICPHGRSPFGTLKLIYTSYLGPFLANFAYFLPILESHQNKEVSCPLITLYHCTLCLVIGKTKARSPTCFDNKWFSAKIRREKKYDLASYEVEY